MNKLARELIAVAQLLVGGRGRVAQIYKKEVSPWRTTPQESKWSAIRQFRYGDVVRDIMVDNDMMYGIVTHINPAEQRVYVYWNSGVIKQHDPEEVALYPYLEENVQKRFQEVAEAAMKENYSDVTPVGEQPSAGGDDDES